MLPLLLLLAAADPAADPAPPRSVLVLDLAATDVPQGTQRLLSSLLADSVGRSGLKTLAQEEMRRVIELESDKAAMGCDTTSCLAEMASAMGVDYVVFGDVGKLGNAFIVTLRLYDSKKNDTISRETLQAPDLDGVRSGLDASVARLMAPVALVAAAAPASSSSGSPLFVPGVVCAAGGGALAVGAGIAAVMFDGTLGDAGASAKDKELAYGAGPWALAGTGFGVVVAAVGGTLIGLSMAEGS
jgi:TolB-like protein